MYKITFVTTGHLYSNPRLVKELSTATQNNWSGDVIYVQTLASLVHYDLEIQKKFPAFNYIAIPWYKKSKLERAVLKIFQYAFQSFNPIYFHPYGSTLFQKTLRTNPNCIIGHNLGTLPVIHLVSQKKNISFIFDVEDYHPGETEDIPEQKKRERILQNHLIYARIITYASPLIGKKIQELLGEKMPPSTLINNTFPSVEFYPPLPKKGKVLLVWYSQTISYKRGLESLINELIPFADKVHLTLIGLPNPTFYKKWIEPNLNFIEISQPISQIDLHHKLSHFDIGVALERSGQEENRDIALTNKIWSYLLSGLYIIANDTLAQKIFINNFPEHGTIVQQNSYGLKEEIKNIINTIDEIRKNSQQRYKAAMPFSWDSEKFKFITLINGLFNS